MSRNRGDRSCAFCDNGGAVVLTEAPRPITNEDAGAYFQEYEGMLVAFAECSVCHGKYLAWCDDTTRKTRHTFFTRQYSEEAPFFDLSFRSTFNDEPGDVDLPTSPPMKANSYKVVVELVVRADSMGAAGSVVDAVLDAGVFQNAINGWDDEEYGEVRVTSAVVDVAKRVGA